MTTTILIIAMIILGVSEVIFATGFYMLLKRVDKLDLDYDFFKKMHEIDEDYYKYICEETGKMAKAYDQHTEIFETANKYFDLLQQQYETMKKQYGFIVNQHGTLLNAWDAISTDFADKYDNIYEQFKLCTEELKKLNEDYIREHVFIDKEDAASLYKNLTQTIYPVETPPYYATVCSEDMEETQ